MEMGSGLIFLPPYCWQGSLLKYSFDEAGERGYVQPNESLPLDVPGASHSYLSQLESYPIMWVSPSLNCELLEGRNISCSPLSLETWQRETDTE